jgi:hypothetical protein
MTSDSPMKTMLTSRRRFHLRAHSDRSGDQYQARQAGLKTRL